MGKDIGEIMVSDFLSILRLIEKKDSLTSCLDISNNQNQSEGVLIGQYFFELHDGDRYSITLTDRPNKLIPNFNIIENKLIH